MKLLYTMTYIMALVFILGETSRRGFDYFSINATTMVEDYLCGILLLLAAFFRYKKHKIAPKIMTAAWAYATGGMFVPFFAHLEAWMRGITFRVDHPHTDIASVVLKGAIWLICLTCFIISLKNDEANNSTG